MTALEALNRAVAPLGLFVMGTGDSRALLGTDAGWWAVFRDSPEYRDGAPHPVDRWSRRVIDALAHRFGARAVYPSDGPPYAPFIAWALATGRFWQSPTGMMVHDRAGLMISIRGALEMAAPLPPAAPRTSPCASCAERPCITACPVGALGDGHAYDVPSCHAYLDTGPGRDCMAAGCRVRRACPVSQGFARPEAQSALHMKAFHP